MERIIELIYKEKSIQTNISLFIASGFGFVSYFAKAEIVLIALVTLMAFSMTKILIACTEWLIQRNSYKSDYSASELNVIDTYIERSTCFIGHSDYKRGVLEEPGLTSLVNRNIISFEESMDYPTGFKLDEEVYKLFLKQSKK